MIIILKSGVEESKIESLKEWLKVMGVDTHISVGEIHTIIGLVGDTSKIDIDLIKALDIVENVQRIQEPFKNANKKFHSESLVVDVEGRKIGNGNFQIFAGPCSVESKDQICEVAHAVKASGAGFLRGGAFKPRTSPYAFYIGVLLF